MPFDQLYFPPSTPALAPEPVIDDEICLTLRKAADVIRARGWCQFISEDSQGRVCMGGAIAYAAIAAHAGWGRAKVQRAFRALPAHLTGGSVGFRHPSEWNNAPGRTKEEVIAALEGAAEARAQSLLAQRGR